MTGVCAALRFWFSQAAIAARVLAARGAATPQNSSAAGDPIFPPAAAVLIDGPSLLFASRPSDSSLTCMPSRAKLMPSAGSGTSGGTSSAGRSTSQEPLGCPYRHRFSRSGSASS